MVVCPHVRVTSCCLHLLEHMEKRFSLLLLSALYFLLTSAHRIICSSNPLRILINLDWQPWCGTFGLTAPKCPRESVFNVDRRIKGSAVHLFARQFLIFFGANFCSQRVALETTGESLSMWERNNEDLYLRSAVTPSLLPSWSFASHRVSHFHSNKSGLWNVSQGGHGGANTETLSSVSPRSCRH